MYNQLTGEIPEEICNLPNLEWVDFQNNQLCPPYPECIEDNIGGQDTSECSVTDNEIGVGQPIIYFGSTNCPFHFDKHSITF